jgi:peptidoglycan/LPS O-acetylase OafA/YrhL
MSIADLLAASTVDSSTVTGARVLGTAAALTALAGAVAGALALVRPTGRRSGVALAAGLAGLLLGALVVITADGGPGTGNGIVGGYAAVALGLIAAGLGGAARARRVREKENGAALR